MAHAWIGLGSNLNQPAEQILSALDELDQLPKTGLLKASRLWQSPPLGPQDQPDFINAVALLDTELSPLPLLDALQAIEHQHQRLRTRHWGPRTLDLDLLLYEQLQMHHPRLQLPHPQMHRRSFVLKPLMELAPCLQLPEQGTIADLLARLEAGTPQKQPFPLDLQNTDPLNADPIKN